MNRCREPVLCVVFCLNLPLVTSLKVVCWWGVVSTGLTDRVLCFAWSYRHMYPMKSTWVFSFAFIFLFLGQFISGFGEIMVWQVDTVTGKHERFRFHHTTDGGPAQIQLCFRIRWHADDFIVEVSHVLEGMAHLAWAVVTLGTHCLFSGYTCWDDIFTQFLSRCIQSIDDWNFKVRRH